jgi:hypothetical protein
MAIRVRKIGAEKASLFNKNFDKIYDYWKDKAVYELGYKGDLRLIKEHGKVLIYIILPEIDQFNNKEDWMNDNDDDIII